MRLSIVNYGFDLNSTVPAYAKKEDDALIKLVQEIAAKYDFGRGAAIVTEAFHTGLENGNIRKYMEKGMDNAIMTFYNPHPTPFLMHHDSTGGETGSLLSVGSTLHAIYVKKKIETPAGIASGYGKVATFIPESSKVGDQSAIDALRSRRLLTVSIGSRVSDNDYRCSVCGKSLYSEECTHNLGTDYEGIRCIAEVYNPLFREYSCVYQPSDIYASVRRMDVMEGEGEVDKKHLIDHMPALGYMSLYEDVTKKQYSSAEIPSKGGEAMGDNSQSQDTAGQSTADKALADLIAKYEEQLASKDAIIVTLATALRDRVEEQESLISKLDLIAQNLNGGDPTSTATESGEEGTTTSTEDSSTETDAQTTETTDSTASQGTEATSNVSTTEAGTTDAQTTTTTSESSTDGQGTDATTQAQTNAAEGTASTTTTDTNDTTSDSQNPVRDIKDVLASIPRKGFSRVSGATRFNGRLSQKR